MTSVPLGISDWVRQVAGSSHILVKNRYFEKNPANLTDQVSLISRPGLRKWLNVGEGPIRAMYSQPGSFDDALFVVSFDSLYRVDKDETVTFLGESIYGAVEGSTPSMAATSRLGSTPEYLYVADGRTLWLYDGTTVSTVTTPDDVAAISVGYIAGYIIVVTAAEDNSMNGRFYWINPGETTIDPLNFATAEKAPDPLLSVRIIGDQIWFLGTNSTEVWYLSGQADAPFARVQGRTFERGVWGGTDVAVKDSVMLIDADGVVYNISGGGPQRVSDNAIEEQIRRAILIQEALTLET